MEREKYGFEDPVRRLLFTLAGTSGVRGLQSAVIGPRIFMGPRALNTLVGMGKTICRNNRVLIITDKIVKPNAEKVKEIFSNAGYHVEMWDEVQPEPPVENIFAGVEAVKNSDASLIIAIGGGSVIDATKVIWLLYERPDVDFRKLSPVDSLGLRKKALFAAIPTTAGTGSEATSAAVITEGGHKMSLSHPEFVPDFAILDPNFTVSLPPNLTLWTGVDALAHAVGAYLSGWANEYTDAYALQAIKLIFKFLPRAVADGRDLEARQKMLIAANLAGLAFSNAAPGIDHALGHTLGKKFGLHHGLCVGAFLPYVFEFYARHLTKTDELAKALGFGKGEEFLNSLVEFYKKLGFSFKFSDYPQVSEEAFKQALPELVSWALIDPVSILSPIPVTPKDYEEIFVASFYGTLKGGVR
ncbi:iron-containing alcohol dehydrogenase [Carboxydothermus ferrireducens]|uniref:Alcohol dehydrogenase class IV n=1 Tax=Carboxydothermus ferrireducens DSM 11255 TaxID=1119529 RepID=A0ABX2REJ6_9THEO|nr:iron-containing alcohol dehydrogenase [Carboxydothermus ferrireducens]NYE58453.1 alcohol dehydrogenase class IV [Carboxydothermus ferrireducens DSM 11255]